MNARIGILGATGYGGGELLRLLLAHPAVTVAHATSRSRAGQPVGAVHRNLWGTTDLAFSNPDVETLAADCDVIIGAMPHGASAETLAPFVDRGVRVVDLSGDFRLRTPADYQTWYKREHPRPDLLTQAVYGCPEFQREAIVGAKLVASPGCFATALNLGMLPLTAAELATGRPQIVAMTGSSGSGAEATDGTHHPTRAQTLRPYKVLTHQHVGEVLQLAQVAGASLTGLDFTPVSAPLVRGILAVLTIPLTTAQSTAQLNACFAAHYASHPFVKVLTDREPECASVAGTNYVELRVRATGAGGAHVVVALDNLVKGGAGQGVQCLNLMLGCGETTGLTWAGSWP